FTPLRVHGPEPCASANSATSARWVETPSFQTAKLESNFGENLYHVHAHAARGASHRPHGRFQIETVQIGHLDLGNLFHLILRDLAHLGLVRLGRPLSQVYGALDEHRHWRRLGN